MTPDVLLGRAYRAVIRAAAALLLALTMSMPAVAEVGCARDSVAHLELGTGSGDFVDDAHPGDESGQGDENEGRQAAHCAFSHGHCAGLQPAVIPGERTMKAPVTYPMAAARPMCAQTATAPDEPPRA